MFATAPGQTFVISTFNESLTSSLDLSATRLAAAYLVGTLLSAACLTPIGRLSDRIGPRRLVGVSAVGLAGAGIALSFARDLTSLTAAFFLLRVCGQGALALASSHALALRFHANLGALEGLRGGTSFASIAVVPPLSVALIDAHGWPFAARVLGIGAGLLGLLSALVLIDADPPRQAAESKSRTALDQSPSFTLSEAMRTSAFWILLGCLATSAGVLTAVHFHLQPILAEARMSGGEAAATFASFAAAGLVATLVGGVLADRIAPPRILGGAMVFLVLGTLSIAKADGPVFAHAGMGLHGVGHGLMGGVVAPTLARYFGRMHHGAIRGLAGTAGVAGSAGGPWMLAAAADRMGGFGRALAALALATALSAFAGFALRRPPPPSSNAS
ncbi:MAG: MFS transporter [Planctomycetota bacterium]